ncbi:MAG: SLBB domain-containing protein [Fimbriimonas sp.]|nr:SLBB domain-containing protein [Fimbriimonas sp.]
MKTSKTYRRLRLSARRTLSIGSLSILALMMLGAGTAFGQLGQNDDDKKKNDQGTGTPVSTILGQGGAQGGGGGGGVQLPGAVGNPLLPPGGQGGGQANPTTTGGAPGVVVVNPGQQQQSSTNAAGQPANISVNPPSSITEIMAKHKFTGAHGLPIFGFSQFEAARYAIEARRLLLNNGAYRLNIDPTKTITGPEQNNLGNIFMPVPDRYQLGPGDALTMRVSSPTQDPTNQDLTVDGQGYITIPQTGEKIVVRGQTLAQLEHTLKIAVKKGVRDADVTVQLKELRSMSITISGESYAPGTYQMPSIMTLFNAIYMSGGPNEKGTLRRIVLKRTNGFVREFDLYDQLVNLNYREDVPLQPGDVIYIPPAENLVALQGEVVRPSVYELKGNEKLRDLLHFGGGVKPSGIAQKISIETTRDHVERYLLDVNAEIKDAANNPVMRDEDDVNVYSIRKDLVNEVTIVGPVDQPHHYGLTKGMTVADLIDAARGFMPNAYMERADLVRRNDDQTTHTLIRIDLEKAYKRDPKANILLQEDDELIIYDVNDIQWMGVRKVTVKGAVNKPGTFERKDNMTVKDVLLQVGGLAPDAFDTLAFVQRTNLDGTVGPLLKINLRKAMLGDPTDDVVLQDRDALTVLTVRESAYIADQTVSIQGPVQGLVTDTVKDVPKDAGTAQSKGPEVAATAVQNTAAATAVQNTVAATNANGIKESGKVPEPAAAPAIVVKPLSFPLSPHMTVRDLILLAGNVLPNADLDHAFIQRTNLDGTPGPLITFNVAKALEGDASNNPELASRDLVTIYTREQANFQPKQEVDIVGAVQVPNHYTLSQGMRVHDLLAIAGNPLPTAYADRAYLQRLNLDGTFGEMKIIDLNKVMSHDPASDIVLKPGDKLNVYTKEETQFRPKQSVSIAGAVQAPKTYPRAEGMTLQDLIRIAGGPTPKASDRIELATARTPEGTPVKKFDLQEMEGPAGAAIILQDGDYVTIPEDATIMDQPMTITVLGYVKNPGPYLVTSNTVHLSQLFKRAGGVLPNAYPLGSQFTRIAKNLRTEAQVTLGPRIQEVITTIQADEFKRALARSEVDKLRALTEASKASQPSVTVAAGGIAPNTNSGPNSTNGLTEKPAATPARELKPASLEPLGTINVNVEKALKHPGSRDDVVVRDGDVIYVPETPISVVVTGAVASATAVRFEQGRSMLYYIDHSGGATSDAALEQIIVIRASGSILKASMKTRLEPGDTIFIPTKVMADHLRDKGADFATELAQVTNAGLLIAIVHALVK